jgi:SAM-dependent methyltransferase
MTHSEREAGDYLMGESTREERRLQHGSEIMAPATEQWLRGAGLAPGLHVLDVGCGVGDVSLLAAALVGREGQVVGVDRSGAFIAAARQRTAELGLPQVSFVKRDLTALSFSEPFDAVVGRRVLMHLADPVGAVRSVTELVRPGGIVAFAELAIPSVRSWPHLPLLDRIMSSIERAIEASGLHPDMGLRLYTTFLEAGLPRPQVRLEGLIGGGPDSPLYRWVVETAQALLPAMTQFSIATPEDLGFETLEERLRAEALRANAVLHINSLVGAWVTKAST